MNPHGARTSEAATGRLTASSGLSYVLGKFGDQLVPAVFLVALIIGLSLVSPNFLSVSNFLDIARVASIIGIMAVGMTIVILTGGIDLSVLFSDAAMNRHAKGTA